MPPNEDHDFESTALPDGPRAGASPVNVKGMVLGLSMGGISNDEMYVVKGCRRARDVECPSRNSEQSDLESCLESVSH